MSKHDRRSEPHDGHRSVSGGLARATVFGINDGLVSNVSLILGFASAESTPGMSVSRASPELSPERSPWPPANG